MGIVVVSALLALAAALLAGGHLTEVESVPYWVGIWLGAALGCQVAGVLLGYLGLPAGPAYAWATLASAVLVALAIKADGRLTGMELIAAGLFLNALVIGVNGNMPVSEYAAARAGAPAAVANDARHEPATADTGLRLLGEVIPVPLPLRPEVDSVGDLLVAAGLAQLIFGAFRPRRRLTPPSATRSTKTREFSRSD